MSYKRAIFVALATTLILGVFGSTNASAETFEVSTKAKNGLFEGTSGVTNWTTETTKFKFECKEAAAFGDLKEGTGIAGNEIGLVLMASWNKGAESCTGPLSIKFAVTTETLVKPWVLLAHELLNGKDLIDGLLHTSLIHFVGANCSYLIEPGLIPVIYHNASQLLLFGPAVNLLAEMAGWGTNKLKLANVNGCFSLINNGENEIYEGSYETASGSDVLIR